MLKDDVWARIQPKPILDSGFPRYFLCEDCMEHKLGRELSSSDLADVPMNMLHPKFVVKIT